MHHVFILDNSIDKENAKVIIDKSLDKENFDHLAKSLRINVGESVLVSPMPYSFDISYKCKVTIVDDKNIVLDIIEKVPANELKIKIKLYQGLPKSDKFEFIIEKAVELGVYSITPVEMTNSVVKINEKSDKKIERYNKISRAAAEQSKRNIVPEVMTAISFDKMIDEIVDDDNINILFYEESEGIDKTKKYLRNVIDIFKKEGKPKVINIIIGPEGGFTMKEIDMAKSYGIEVLSLGTRILRTETAAITAMGILMYESQ